MAYSCRTLLHFYKQLSMFWLNNIMMAINCTFDNKKLGIILSSQLKFLIDISRGKANVTIKYSNIGGKKKTKAKRSDFHIQTFFLVCLGFFFLSSKGFTFSSSELLEIFCAACLVCLLGGCKFIPASAVQSEYSLDESLARNQNYDGKVIILL